MADITANMDIQNILKHVYKDGIESVLYRNSPLLKMIPNTRTEGKDWNYAVLYGRGGAVSGFAQAAAQYAIANSTAKNTTFAATPGYLFSDYTTTYMQKAASKSAKGAYIKAEANQFFASLEAFRKTLAAILYGSGYGEIGQAQSAVTAVATNNTMTLTDAGIIHVDIGTQFQRVNGTDPSVPPDAAVYTITAIDDETNTITFDASAAGGTINVNDWLVFTGNRDPSGGPEYPIGLEGLFPTGTNRTTAKLQQPFYGNTLRANAPSRLCGQYLNCGVITATNTLSKNISELQRRCRRYGAEPDVIIINDKDRLYLHQEIGSQQTYWQSVSEKKLKPSATTGFAEIAFAFSTSWLDKVIDDPYCPNGKFYILSIKNGPRTNIEWVIFTDMSKAKSDGISADEPGRADPNAEQEEYSDQPYKLNVDDLVTVSDAGKGNHGSIALVELKFAGTLVCYSPASCGVGIFSYS